MKCHVFSASRLGISKTEFLDLAPTICKFQGWSAGPWSFDTTSSFEVRTHRKQVQIEVKRTLQVNGPINDLIDELKIFQEEFGEGTVEVKSQQDGEYEHWDCDTVLIAHGWRDASPDEVEDFKRLQQAHKELVASQKANRVALAERQLAEAQRLLEQALKESEK